MQGQVVAGKAMPERILWPHGDSRILVRLAKEKAVVLGAHGFFKKSVTLKPRAKIRGDGDKATSSRLRVHSGDFDISSLNANLVPREARDLSVAKAREGRDRHGGNDL